MSDHTEPTDKDDEQAENTGHRFQKGNKAAQGNSGGPGAPEGNARAMTHGVRADPVNLYRHLDDDQQEWVDQLTQSYVDVLEFGEDDPRVERVRRACIHILQSWRGEDRILDDGLSEDTVMGVSDTGEPIVDKDGHHLHRFTFKRDQEARQILKSLGAFDDPQSKVAEEIGNAADQWEKMLTQSAGESDS